MNSTNNGAEGNPDLGQAHIQTINIYCNKVTGDVEVSGNGKATVHSGHFVKWNVTCSKITKIEIIPGSKGFAQHKDIWEIKPAPLGALVWMGQVKTLGDEDPPSIEGFYSVIWFDEFNTPHVIDPLIEVNK